MLSDRNISGGRYPSIVFTDVMTLFFVFFVVIYPFSILDGTKITNLFSNLASALHFKKDIHQPSEPLGTAVSQNRLQKDSQRLSLEDLEGQIRASLNEFSVQDRVILSRNQEGVIISLLTEGLFDSESISLRPTASTLLKRIGTLLLQTQNAIRIEGHTDDLPIETKIFASNWECSISQAISILRNLLAYGLSPSRLSIVGYAGNRPVAPNDSVEGRRRNRRVDIIVISEQPTWPRTYAQNL